MTRLLLVAVWSISLVSDISTMKVERPLARSSDATVSQRITSQLILYIKKLTSHSGKYGINEAHFDGRRRNIATDLSHQDDERNHSNTGAFPVILCMNTEGQWVIRNSSPAHIWASYNLAYWICPAHGD